MKETIYKKVFDHLEANKECSIEELLNFFPEYSAATLKNYRVIFRKERGITQRKWNSYKPEVLDYLATLDDAELAFMTNTQLKKKFTEASAVTLSLHLSEVRTKRKVKPIGTHRERPNTKRAIIFKFLDENPDKRTANDVYIKYPYIVGGTITSIVVLWYELRGTERPKNVLSIPAKWSEDKLNRLFKRHYPTYISVMHRLGREPKPQKYSPTHEAIISVKNTLTSNEKLDLTPAKACMLVSCKPAVELLKKIYHENVDQIDFDKTEKTIQEIEKRLFRKNIFRSYSTIVGTALYLANKNISQTESEKIMEDFGHCTAVSMRTLCRITKLRKKNYWSEN